MVVQRFKVNIHAYLPMHRRIAYFSAGKIAAKPILLEVRKKSLPKALIRYNPRTRIDT